MKPSKYQRGKARARDAAIIYQLDFDKYNYSWYDLVTIQAYFEKLARRFGLLREFRENAII